MNTEKLEKLRKSLDNKFIPDNMKDKIRAEIKKLEADIKTDETITATEVKKEVKEIEKKVEKALEVAEEKEEKAEAKAPVKRTTRKPATRKPATSRTKTPKVEPKEKSTKKSIFSIAKEIRKDGESWEDAKERAKKMMTSKSTETKSKVRTETQKLLASIRRKKELKGLTSNIKRDINRTALPKGRRVSKKGWKNQYGESEGGKVYYEYRDDHSDRLAPSYKDKIYLAEGGGVDTVYDVDVNYKQINGYVGRFPMNQKTIDRLEEAFYFMYFDLYDTTNKKPMSYVEVSEILFDSMKDKGLYEKGGALTNERRHVNKSEDYEVRYAKDKPTRKGYKGKRSFDNGGDVSNGLSVVKVKFKDPKYNYTTSMSASMTKESAEKYFIGKSFNVGEYPKENMKEVVDIEFYPAGTYKENGGSLTLTPETPLARGLDIDYTTLVGETDAMSSGEMFANGGSIGQMVNFEDWQLYDRDTDLEKMKKSCNAVRKNGFKAIVVEDKGMYYVLYKSMSDSKGKRVYAEGGEMFAGGGSLNKNDIEKLNAYWESYHKGVMAGKKDDGYTTITNKEELHKYITSILGDNVKEIELIEKGKNYPYNNSYPYREDIYIVTLKNGTTFKIVRSYGKPRWDGNVDYKEQIIVENIKQYANGGGIPNNYEGRTPEDVWNSLSVEQRKHFLKDHRVFVSLAEDKRASLYRYDELPKYLLIEIKEKLTEHIKEGQYAMGGSLGNHGLKQGDQIIKTMSGGVQKVKTKSGDIVYVNLANGYRGVTPPLPFVKGGGVEKRSLKSVIHLVDWKGEGIKKWYLRSYPKDEMGEELNDTVTFKDLWDALNGKNDVYEIIGVGDSLIRERLFEYLALLYNVDYDVVYKKWLESDDYAKGGALTNERKHVNKSEDYEVRYAKDKPSRKGYKGKRSFDDGGLFHGGYGLNKTRKFVDENYEVIVYPEKLEFSVIITDKDTIDQDALDKSGVQWFKEDWGYSIEAYSKPEFNKAIKVVLGVNKRFDDGGSLYSAYTDNPLKYLSLIGAKPHSDLNYSTEHNGINYYIGEKKDKYGDNIAIVVAFIEDDNNYIIEREDAKEMSETAKRKGVDKVELYTNYGVEIHTTQKPQILGFDKIHKVTNNYATGGMIYKDLFEDYENQPAELSEIVSAYMEKFEEGDYDYEDSKKFLAEVEAIGYTFDYGLDNEPYGLRPIGVELSQIEGYEEEYKKGGEMPTFKSKKHKND